MSDVCYAGSLRLSRKQVNFFKTLGNDALVEGMMTKGAKAHGILCLLASQHMKLKLTEAADGSYFLVDKKKHTIRLRFSHRKGNVCFTKSSHRGTGRGFEKSEFINDLAHHDGFLIIDTAEFSLINPVLHFWGISPQTVRLLYEDGLLPNGSLTRNRLEVLTSTEVA